MSNDQYLIKTLFAKYVNGSASPEEVKQLFSLISDKQYDEEMKNLLLGELQETELQDEYDTERWNNVFHKVKTETELIEYNEQPKRTFGFRRLAVAASIILCLSAGGYFLLHKPSPQQQVTKNQPHDIAPGHNQATLTLAGGQKIILTKNLNGKLAQQGNVSIRVNKGSNIIYQSSNTIATQKNAIAYNTLSTARGQQSPYPLILPDGSKVWLNAASSITFPTQFTTNERKVTITGEAYVEVTHNTKQPFRVTVGNQTIEDIGTEFNINAYTDEPSLKTTLISGSVKITANSNNKSVVLKPGQQAINNSKELKVQTIDTEGITAWKNNYFQFDDNNIEGIMRQVARWYDVDVKYETDAPKTRMLTGTISRYKNVSSVLRKIEITGTAHFKVSGNQIIVTN